MRIVIVSPCHPDTSHVCALRGRAFADALAAMGHRVLLITPPLEEAGKGSDPDGLPARLDTHDWSQPYSVSACYRSGSILPALRGGRVPGGFRQAMIAWQYVAHGGVYEDWYAGALPLLPKIAEKFRPNIVWAIFGNTGCWRIGQAIAHRSGCPWVADLKDSWTNFIPSVFRARLARRYGDATQLTALSGIHADTMAGNMPDVARTVIYSGIARDFLADRETPPPATASGRLILMSGGTYGLATELRTLLNALSESLGRLALPAEETVFAYAGADGEVVAAAASVLAGRCTVRMLGFIPLARLQAMQREAALNLYLRCPPFHHKVFELFAAGRPIVCYPAETAETTGLAAEVGARFYSCGTPDALANAFATTLGQTEPGGRSIDLQALARYSWEEQAKALERILMQSAESHRQ